MIKYLLGKRQFAPDWFYKLPKFFQPRYLGDNKFKWLGVTFTVENALAGDTLFMAWRNK